MLTALQQQLSILSVRSYYGSMFGRVDLGTHPKNIFMSRAQRASFSVHSGPADCQNTSLIKYSSEGGPLVSDQQEKEGEEQDVCHSTHDGRNETCHFKHLPF